MSEPITGLNGVVKVAGNRVADTRNWQVTRNADIKTYSSSDTAGWQKTGTGNKNWSISFSAYAQGGELNPGFAEGDLVAFEGHTETGRYLTGSVRIQRITQAVAVEGGDFESFDVEGIGDGAYSLV